MIQNKNKFMMNISKENLTISKENNIYPFGKIKNIMVHFFEDNPTCLLFCWIIIIIIMSILITENKNDSSFSQ